ncbi:unnamed protein product, partial [Meganyctiphanes norvegica]
MNKDDIASTLFPVTQANVGSVLSKFSTKDLLDNEVKEYIDIVVADQVDFLKWWQDHKEKMPKLASIANRFLGAPPSSVESERLFSVGGLTYTPKRSRLLPANGEMLITLAFNLKHFSNMEIELPLPVETV